MEAFFTWWNNLGASERASFCFSLLAAGLGLYGAILSTVNFVNSRRKDLPRISVATTDQIIASVNGISVTNAFVSTTITNIGHLPVYVARVHFLVKGHKNEMVPTDPKVLNRLPLRLDAQASVTIYHTRPSLIDAFKRFDPTGTILFCAAVNLQGGQRFKGPWRGIDRKKPIGLHGDDDNKDELASDDMEFANSLPDMNASLDPYKVAK